jgi:hypothetical protein
VSCEGCELQTLIRDHKTHILHAIFGFISFWYAPSNVKFHITEASLSAHYSISEAFVLVCILFLVYGQEFNYEFVIIDWVTLLISIKNLRGRLGNAIRFPRSEQTFCLEYNRPPSIPSLLFFLYYTQFQTTLRLGHLQWACAEFYL